MTTHRILIVNIFGIGDVLFTTPLIRSIKRAWPDSFIGYLANSRTAPMLRCRPDVDEVIVYDRDEFHQVSQKSKAAFFNKWFAMLRTLQKGKYGIAFDLSMSTPFSALLALAGIPRRVGFNYKNRSPFLTEKIPFAGYERRHVIEHYLSLLERVGIADAVRTMDFPVGKEDKEAALRILQETGLSAARPLVAMFPGGGASWGKEAIYKRWPAERYAQLADKIIANSDAAIILLGDNSEEELCRRIAQVSPQKIRVAAGKTTLTQTAALLGRTQLAVVNDGGPLHVAVAAGIPTVSVFGPVDERVYGPYPASGHEVVTSGIACRPCYRHFRRAQCEHISCLNIEVDEVFSRVKKFLEKKAAAGRVAG